MSTVTPATRPSRTSSASVLTPASVSIASCVFRRDAVLEGVFRDAADAVAAHLAAAAVRVVHLHPAVGDVGRADQNEPVGADGGGARRDQARDARRVGDLVGEGVDVDVIVADAVHLGEGQAHVGLSTSVVRAVPQKAGARGRGVFRRPSTPPPPLALNAGAPGGTHPA